MRNLKNLVALVLVAVVAASLARGAVWEWSPTAGNNAKSDSTIDWSEGMSPSSVNDSARAMMARIANWRDDNSGSVTTSGTSTAYLATSNQGFNATPTTGQLFVFTPHATNGVNPTLAVDGGTAWPIQQSPSVAVGAAVLIQGTPYGAMFNGTAWVLRDFYATSVAIPIGAMLPYTGATAPNANFVLPYGQCISRTTYATYFTQVSTTFGVCDGVTTFGVPDMRAQIPVALDNMGGSAANRLTNSATGCGTAFTSLGATCSNGAESQTLTVAQMPAHNHTDSGHSHTLPNSVAIVSAGGSWGSQAPANESVGGVSTNTGTANIQNTGGGGAHPQVMPVIGVYYILRVL